MGGPGRAPDHIAVQRGRDAGRRRGRQHAGADVHRRPARSPTSPTSGRARRRRPAAGLRRGRLVDGKTYAVPYYAGSQVRLLPQGPVREGRPRGADHDGRVRRRRDRPEEADTASRAELLRLLVPRPGLAQRRGVRLGRRRRLAVAGRRRVERRAVHPRVRRGPDDGPAAVHRGVRRRQGRQRGRPAGAVLRRRDRDALRARLGPRDASTTPTSAART